MQSAVERLSPTSVRLTVEVTFDELKPSLDAAYKKISGQVTIPGFRKGKAPPQIIDQRVGRAAVLDEAVNDTIPRLYREALEENELTPMSQPELDVTEFEDGQKLTFTAELDVRPNIEIPDYEGLSVEVDEIEVTDEEVESELQGLRERFGTLLEVDRPAADGDYVTIDLAASKDGELVEDAQASGLSYQIGSGNMLDGLDEALTGMEAGESKTFPSTLVGGDRVGEEVEVEVTLQGVKEQQLPDVDEEFAQTASEFDTVEELREDLRDRLVRGKRMEQASSARDAVLEKLLDMTEVPIPEKAVSDEVASRREQIQQQLAQAGLSEQEYLDAEQQTADEFEAEVEKRARDALAAEMVLEEIAKKEQLGVEESELSQHILRRAQSIGMSPDQFAEQAMQSGQVPLLVSEVVRGKALAKVVESAEVTDTSGAKVELKNLRSDGTYGEPEAADAESGDTEDAAADSEAEAEGESQGGDTDSEADEPARR